VTLKSERHHYWPKALSAFWADSEGQTSRISCDGTVLRIPPHNFGVIGNAHHVKLGDPWEHTIETAFQSADSNIKPVVEYLLSQKPKAGFSKRQLEKRMSGFDMPKDKRAQLGECIASLIVRSPAFRNLMRLTADSGRDGLAYDSATDANNLIASNIGIEYRRISRSLKTGGKMVIMYSEASEFIYGDGFLHNLGGGAGSKFFVPLTPDMAVAFTSPLVYFSPPDGAAILLSKGEIRQCNEIMQVYSKDYIYFRQECPTLTPQFRSRHFLQYDYHQHPWLDEVLYVASRTR
jgi:hypothetical protein